MSIEKGEFPFQQLTPSPVGLQCSSTESLMRVVMRIPGPSLRRARATPGVVGRPASQPSSLPNESMINVSSDPPFHLSIRANGPSIPALSAYCLFKKPALPFDLNGIRLIHSQHTLGSEQEGPNRPFYFEIAVLVRWNHVWYGRTADRLAI